MVSTTDLAILALGGLLAVLYLYKDTILGPKTPSSTTSSSTATNGGGGGGGSKLNANGTKKYSGDPRDFVAKMKDGVSSDSHSAEWLGMLGARERERRREGRKQGGGGETKVTWRAFEGDRFTLVECLFGEEAIEKELLVIL